jgi:hypothetical protein
VNSEGREGALGHKVNSEGREGALGHKVNSEGREGALGHKVNSEGREGALGYKSPIHFMHKALNGDVHEKIVSREIYLCKELTD